MMMMMIIIIKYKSLHKGTTHYNILQHRPSCPSATHSQMLYLSLRAHWDSKHNNNSNHVNTTLLFKTIPFRPYLCPPHDKHSRSVCCQ